MIVLIHQLRLAAVESCDLKAPLLLSINGQGTYACQQIAQTGLSNIRKIEYEIYQ